MQQDQNLPSNPNNKPLEPMSLETIIAMSLFGWLALSMTLMGLGIW